MSEKVKGFLAMLPPNKKVNRYEFLATHEGMVHDVHSINKGRKTITLCTSSGNWTVNLADIDKLVTMEDYMKK